MSKKRKKSVPVNMPKKEDKFHVGTVGGIDTMLHSAGKPWNSGSSFAHNNKSVNPKNIRRDSKLSIRKGDYD